MNESIDVLQPISKSLERRCFGLGEDQLHLRDERAFQKQERTDVSLR